MRPPAPAFVSRATAPHGHRLPVRETPVAGMAQWRESAETLTLLMAPSTPYVAEEMWERLGHEPTVARVGWPVVDPELLVEESVTAVVQVKGKVRDRLEVPADVSAADLEAAALASEKVQAAMAGAPVRKVIVRAPNLVNIVV